MNFKSKYAPVTEVDQAFVAVTKKKKYTIRLNFIGGLHARNMILLFKGDSIGIYKISKHECRVVY